MPRIVVHWELFPTTLTLQGSPIQFEGPGLRFEEHNSLCVVQLDPSLSAQLSFLQEPGALMNTRIPPVPGCCVALA